MTQTEAYQSINHPKIEGKRWSLYSSHNTKREAEDRAKTVRKFYKRACIRKISRQARKTVGSKSGDWGVYHPYRNNQSDTVKVVQGELEISTRREYLTDKFMSDPHARKEFNTFRAVKKMQS
jgi:hypothetical protein